MKKLALSAVVGGLVGAGSAAFAADLSAGPVYTKVPRMVSAAYNWSGFYVGVNAGALWTNHDFSTLVDPGTGLHIPDNLSAVSAAGTGGNSKTGFIGGGQIGYNWQAPGSSLVVGLEADLSGASSNSTRAGAGSIVASLSTNPFSTSNSAKYDWLATARGRLGYSADKSLIYITGGLAVADLKLASAYSTTLFDGAGAASRSTTKAGWTLGAGWEYAFAPAWSAKLEYLYVHFDDVSLDFTAKDASGGVNVFHTRSSFDDNHILRVGLNHRLGEVVPDARVPSAIPAYDWSGFYAGAYGGYDWGRAHVIDNGVLEENAAPVKGAVAGLLAGHNWQRDVLVYGLEGDFGYASLRGHGTTGLTSDGDSLDGGSAAGGGAGGHGGSGAGGLGGGSSTAAGVIGPDGLSFNQYKVDWTGNIRGRLGVTVAPQTLVYAAGGLALANFNFREAGATTSGSRVMAGWTIGAGVEQAFTKNLIGRVEYLYANYGHRDFTVAPGDIYSVGFKSQTLRGALAWKF